MRLLLAILLTIGYFLPSLPPSPLPTTATTAPVHSAMPSSKPPPMAPPQTGRTITLAAALPALSSNLTIDGTSQPGTSFGITGLTFQNPTPPVY